ncbi:hypothetical protein, partial, partial [Absidia glauca]
SIGYDTAVEDSVGFGSILIKALSNHPDLVKQVRATYASTDVAHRPVFNVAYVARVVPLLYVENGQDDVEERSGCQQRRQEHRGKPYHDDKRNNNHHNSNYHNNNHNNNNGHNKNGHNKNGNNSNGGRSGNGKHPFHMKVNKCRHCNVKYLIDISQIDNDTKG